MSYYSNTKHIILYFLIQVTLLLGGTTGKIAGKVTDMSGEPLIGCNIIVEGTSLGAATNLAGEYYILNIPPGSYNLKAIMIGYSIVQMKDLHVIVDLTAKANFSLTTEAIEGEEIVVTAEKPIVRLDQTSMSAVVSAEDLDNLPVSDIGDVIELQAGVVRDQGGGFHIRGGRSGEVSFWVDGVSTSDAYDGSSGLEVENSGIQEIQVISGTFNAEYGQAMSGIVNVVTKDGGDKYEGRIEYYSGGYHTNHSDLYSMASPFSQWQSFSDFNNNGNWDYGEILYDLNDNNVWDEGEAYWDLNGNQEWDGDEGSEPLNSDVGYDGYLGDFYDYNGDGKYTQPSPGEGNGRKDWGEHTFSLDQDGYVDKLNLISNYNQQLNISGNLSGPVPFLNNKFTFYSNIRYFSSEGRFYGKNIFRPNGSFGDESIVSLSPFSKNSGQFKLTWKPSSILKIAASTFLTNKEYRNYNSYYKYNPDGIQWNFEKDQSNMLALTHSLSSSTFYEIKFLDYSTSYWQHLYESSTNVPYESNIVSASQALSLDLTDSISVRTGYDTYKDYPRFSISELEDGTYSVIDRSDQEGYMAPDAFVTPAWSFGLGGTQNGQFSRNTSFQQIKFDISSQINSTHFVKAGLLFKQYDMQADNKSLNHKTVGEWSITSHGDTLGYNPLAGARVYPFTPTINPTYTSGHNYFKTNPQEAALYLQDKIELNELIINVGVRFDYFDPKWHVPSDERLPGNKKYYLAQTQNDTIIFWDNEYESLHSGVTIFDSLSLEGAVKVENLFTSGVAYDSADGSYKDLFNTELNNMVDEYRWAYGYKSASKSYQLSPRIGIAYPITDRGVVHVSYGHFFQIPHFSYLYENPEFEINDNNNGGILGNADLKPERTVMYEIGFKQEVAHLTSLDMTIFYRDTRDWVGISAPIKKYPVGNYR